MATFKIKILKGRYHDGGVWEAEGPGYLSAATAVCVSSFGADATAYRATAGEGDGWFRCYSARGRTRAVAVGRPFKMERTDG